MFYLSQGRLYVTSAALSGRREESLGRESILPSPSRPRGLPRSRGAGAASRSLPRAAL